MDRFMLKTVIDYPEIEEEREIVRRQIKTEKEEVKPVVGLDQIAKARQVIDQLYVDDRIEQYILDLVFASRYPDRYRLERLKPLIAFGGSPRASINLAKAARVHAFIQHRGYVIPEDVRAVATDVLRHRIGLTYEAEAENMKTEDVVREILDAVEVP
jgi:MoxR-like ATPase